jgi:hypothetical protein
MAMERDDARTRLRVCPWCGKALRDGQLGLCDLCEAAYWLSELEFDLAVREASAVREERRK